MPAHQYCDLLGQLLAKVNGVADISLLTLPEVNHKWIVDITRHTILFEQMDLQTVRGLDKFLCEYLTPAQTLDPDPLRRFSIYVKWQRNYVYATEHHHDLVEMVSGFLKDTDYLDEESYMEGINSHEELGSR